MISLQHFFRIVILSMGLMAACTARVIPTPTTPTVTPLPTATLRPTVTPTPTPIPSCPAPNPSAAWTPPDMFAGYPEAIQAYLTAGGSRESLVTILSNASSINDQWGGVQAFDLTGDDVPETIVWIFDPAAIDRGAAPDGMLLVYGCVNRKAMLLYVDDPQESQSMVRIVRLGNLIGAKHGGQVAIQSSICGAHTCFNTFDILGWNGTTFISLMAAPLTLPAGTYLLTQSPQESALGIEAHAGMIASVGAGPQRTETQIWKWNGAQYVKVSSKWSPVEYRIQAVYEGDDAFNAGDYSTAIDWYSRVITDDSLKDWLTEIQYPKAHDRDTLRAYARFRLLLIGVLRGDANAHDQLDQLTAEFPEGSPVHDTQQMAQVFWDKYQATQDLKAACAAANAYANASDNDQYLIVDDLNLFGYANRTYTSDDMCPIQS